MEDREWEAMKSGSEEYRLFLQERERAKEPTNGRHAHEQPWPQRDERWRTTVQRCHSCGWLGTPILPQQCPECKALDILSVHAEPHDTESERRGTPDIRHPPATTLDYPSSPLKGADYPSSPLKGESSTTTPGEESGGFQRAEEDFDAYLEGLREELKQKVDEPIIRNSVVVTINDILKERRRKINSNEPNQARRNDELNNAMFAEIIDEASLKYAEAMGVVEEVLPEEEVLSANETKTVYVAADTGAEEHCIGPSDLP